MIYFIGDGWGTGDDLHMKIGYTANSGGARMAALQTGNPKPLRLYWETLGNLETEALLHTYFKDCHCRGEWFCFNKRFDDLFFLFVVAACGARYQAEGDDEGQILTTNAWLIGTLAVDSIGAEERARWFASRRMRPATGAAK